MGGASPPPREAASRSSHHESLPPLLQTRRNFNRHCSQVARGPNLNIGNLATCPRGGSNPVAAFANLLESLRFSDGI